MNDPVIESAGSARLGAFLMGAMVTILLLATYKYIRTGEYGDILGSLSDATVAAL